MAADGSIIIDTEIDNKKAQQELNKLNKQIESLERQLNEKKQGRIPLEKNLDTVSAKLEEARRQLSMLEDEQRAIHAAMQPGASAEDFLAAYANQEKINNALKQQQSEVAAIEKEWESANRKLADYDSKIAVINQRISAAKAQAGGIHQNMARTGPATQVMANAMNRVQKSTARFSMRLREVIRSALVFTVISQGLAAVRDWMGKVIKTNSEATAAIARLKGALLTLAQPLVNVIIPAFTAFVNVLTRVVLKIAQLLSALFGTTIENSANAAEGLYDETEAIDGVGSAAQKAAKSLANFDEINQLSANKISNAGVSSDGIKPTFDFENIKSGFDEVQDAVEAIGATIAGWMVSKGFLNVLEMLTGIKIPAKIGLGISLIGAGATLGAENILSILNEEYPNASLRSAIKTAISGFMAGLGFVALGAGGWAIPVAIAVAFAVTDLIVNWDNYQEMWQHELEAGKALLTGDMEGFWEEVSQAYLTWMKMDNWGTKLGKAIWGEDVWNQAIAYLENGGTIDVILSRFWGLVAQWFSEQEWFQAVFGGFSGIGKAFKTWSESEWVKNISEWLEKHTTWFDPEKFKEWAGSGFLGISRALSEFIAGDNWIGTMAKFWQSVLNFFNSEEWYNAAKNGIIGIIDYLAEEFPGEWTKVWNNIKDIFKGIMNGIIGQFEGFINRNIRGLNVLISGLNKLIELAGDLLGFHFSIPSIPEVTIPRLAKGAVIPPNREFLAVLGDQKSGTNIETPLSTMVQAFRQAMSDMGYGGEQTVILQVDKDQLGKVVYKLNKTETRRIGVNLAGV